MANNNLLLLGAGKIGRMIARLLVDSGDYDVLVGDYDTEALMRIQEISEIGTLQIDAGDHDQLLAAMKGRDIVISALSFRFNPRIAQATLETGASYFDLTEDVETTRQVRRIAANAAKNQVFMPQCGLAPGFISIVANDLVKRFGYVDTVRMRVGALPQFPTDALKYNLTWSTDGLINEYCNPCEVIHKGRRLEVLPLEGLEHFSLDGDRYEAFNTSGGLGTLCDSLADKVRELNYKTIRYMGHRDLVSFLVNDLKLIDRRDILKDILEHSVPVTFQDVVITFCTVTGQRKGQLVQISDARKIYSQKIGNEFWSAIQITTAAGVCAAIDAYREGQLPSSGFVCQEQLELETFLNNRFGRRYRSKLSADALVDG